MAVNLRSFVPPPAVDTAPLPLNGVRAPSLPGIDVADGRPRVVCFLRHTGCPFAEATLHQARVLAAQEPGAEVVAVTHSDYPTTARWIEVAGGAGDVHVIRDPGRAVYAAWGLGRTSLRHFAGRRSLRAVAERRAHGVRNTRADGTRWQGAGTFGIDGQGVVRSRHVPAHAGDLPDLAAVLRAAQRAG